MNGLEEEMDTYDVETSVVNLMLIETMGDKIKNVDELKKSARF